MVVEEEKEIGLRSVERHGSWIRGHVTERVVPCGKHELGLMETHINYSALSTFPDGSLALVDVMPHGVRESYIYIH